MHCATNIQNDLSDASEGPLSEGDELALAPAAGGNGGQGGPGVGGGAAAAAVPGPAQQPAAVVMSTEDKIRILQAHREYAVVQVVGKADLTKGYPADKVAEADEHRLGGVRLSGGAANRVISLTAQDLDKMDKVELISLIDDVVLKAMQQGREVAITVLVQGYEGEGLDEVVAGVRAGLKLQKSDAVAVQKGHYYHSICGLGGSPDEKSLDALAALRRFKSVRVAIKTEAIKVTAGMDSTDVSRARLVDGLKKGTCMGRLFRLSPKPLMTAYALVYGPQRLVTEGEAADLRRAAEHYAEEAHDRRAGAPGGEEGHNAVPRPRPGSVASRRQAARAFAAAKAAGADQVAAAAGGGAVAAAAGGGAVAAAAGLQGPGQEEPHTHGLACVADGSIIAMIDAADKMAETAGEAGDEQYGNEPRLRVRLADESTANVHKVAGQGLLGRFQLESGEMAGFADIEIATIWETAPHLADLQEGAMVTTPFGHATLVSLEQEGWAQVEYHDGPGAGQLELPVQLVSKHRGAAAAKQAQRRAGSHLLNKRGLFKRLHASDYQRYPGDALDALNRVLLHGRCKHPFGHARLLSELDQVWAPEGKEQAGDEQGEGKVDAAEDNTGPVLAICGIQLTTSGASILVERRNAEYLKKFFSEAAMLEENGHGDGVVVAPSVGHATAPDVRVAEGGEAQEAGTHALSIITMGNLQHHQRTIDEELRFSKKLLNCTIDDHMELFCGMPGTTPRDPTHSVAHAGLGRLLFSEGAIPVRIGVQRNPRIQGREPPPTCVIQYIGEINLEAFKSKKASEQDWMGKGMTCNLAELELQPRPPPPEEPFYKRPSQIIRGQVSIAVTDMSKHPGYSTESFQTYSSMLLANSSEPRFGESYTVRAVRLIPRAAGDAHPADNEPWPLCKDWAGSVEENDAQVPNAPLTRVAQPRR
eukprot:g2090.t1